MEAIKMKWWIYALILALATLIAVIGCSKSGILSPDNGGGDFMQSPAPLYSSLPPPSGLTTIDVLGQQLTLWPYIGENLLGEPHDPVNLIFIGQADPRDLRQALLALDGDRTAYGFPNDFPFNCTWRDCMGDIQGAYGDPNGWVGNAIQLDCGEFQMVRFHLRFFKAGNYTIGNCHFEFLIPGTHEHQVLNWELAEQLVTADFMRSGLLDEDYPVIPVPGFNDSPWGEIPVMIYNALPPELRALAGGPPGDVEEPVPMQNDGTVTVLNLANKLDWIPCQDNLSLTLQFDMVIPKPFCSGGIYQYLYAQGPIELGQTVRFSRDGRYSSRFSATGTLNLTPVDPSTDPPTPLGETYQAEISQRQFAWLNHQTTFARTQLSQVEVPDNGPYQGSLYTEMQIGPFDNNHYTMEIQCEP
jgi:hypothetical protein